MKNYEKAAKLLERRKDINSLSLALDLAELEENVDLTMSLADKLVFEALFADDILTAYSIIEKYPSIKVNLYFL